MEPKQIQQAIEHLFDQTLRGLVVFTLFIVVTIGLKSLAASILYFLKARFSDIGVGQVVEFHKEKWRVDEIRFSFVVMRSEDRVGVVMRLPLQDWVADPKILVYPHKSDQKNLP